MAAKGPLDFMPFVDEKIDINSGYYKRNVLPVDHGWAWVICLGGFLVYFVFGMSNQTLALLFVELVYFYDTTITVVSLVFMFSVFSIGFMSIITTNFIVPRFGEKWVVTVAGILGSLFSVGLTFSPNIWIFIVFGTLKGMTSGAIFVPSISLIRLYFKNRRSIAQIIANVGQSIAAIVTPPIIRIIRKEYGISGMFIVLAGIELHITFAGLLLRPVSSYRFRPRTEVAPTFTKVDVHEDIMISEDYNELKLQKKKKMSRMENVRQSVIFQSPHRSRASSKSSSRAPDDEEMELTDQEMRNRRWMFKMVIFATIPGAANLYLRNYIPSITESQGVTLDQSAILVTIVGSVDLLSRLCVGLFSDFHILTSIQLITITQLCLASACHCLRFFTTFENLVVFVMLIGGFVGTRITVLPLLAIEVVGVNRMPQALSIISTVGALSSAIMNPVFGYIAETKGNYITVMDVCGGCFTASSLILIMVPIIVALFQDDEIDVEENKLKIEDVEVQQSAEGKVSEKNNKQTPTVVHFQGK